MLSLKPYLLRATYRWVLDNGQTPHISVNSGGAGLQIPAGYGKDGNIVLNIHPRAARGFEIDEAQVKFNAQFSGKYFKVKIPQAAVLGIYAQETGQGIAFPDETPADAFHKPPLPGEMSLPRGRPVLRLVK